MPGVPLKTRSSVAETLLIPLYVRAQGAQRADAFVRDPRAVELVKRIDYDYSRFKLQGHDRTAIVLRLREFDRHAREFVERRPDGVVVHIGCGLDTRFERVAAGNDRIEWYDLDLPEVIELRRELIGGDAPHYHHLAGSVFDDGWLAGVAAHSSRPFLFMAEAVLPYFEEAQVKSLVLKLRDRFPGADLVCDAMTPFMVWANNLQLAVMPLGARLHWGLKHARDLESWGEGICLLDEWTYFDRPEPRLGAIRWMARVPFLAKANGVYHYRLGTPAL